MIYSRIYLRLIIFISILTWCAGFSLNSLLSGTEISVASTPLFNLFYDNVCHQDKSKLLSLNGFDFLVCTRCSGIYFGALIASAFLLINLNEWKISINIFLTASFLLLADVLANNFLFGSYNKTSAFTTGIFFGSVTLVILLNLSEKYFLTKVKH